jgi:hypothetical protein
MSKPSRRFVRMLTSVEDRAITKAAKADPDAQPLTPKQLKSMVPVRALRGRLRQYVARQARRAA